MNTPSTPAPRISSPEAKTAREEAVELAERAGIDMDDWGLFIDDLAETLTRFAAAALRSPSSPPTAKLSEDDPLYKRAVEAGFIAPSSPAGEREARDIAKRIAALLDDADDRVCGWQSCTGCHETNEGAETGDYPFSEAFGCYQGGGCYECGGIGVVWDDYGLATDFGEQARAALASPVPPPLPGEAVAWQVQMPDGATLFHADERGTRAAQIAAEAYGIQPRPLYATPPARAPGITEEMVEVGWAYQDKRWDADRWHLCQDQPRAFEGRKVVPVYVLEAASISRPEREKWTQAATDVLAERRRQIEAEGWTAEHDDTEHPNGELAEAAACYARGTDRVNWMVPDPEFPKKRVMSGRTMWPWDPEWWKPSSRRHNLVKSGALILAEIERLDRLSTPSTDHVGGGE